MSRRRPTPRHDGEGPSRLVVALVSVLLIGLVGLWVWWTYSDVAHAESAELPVRKITHDSMVVINTYDREIIRRHVLIDSDSGVQYIVNDRGVCCPRISYDGSIMGFGRGRAVNS